MVEWPRETPKRNIWKHGQKSGIAPSPEKKTTENIFFEIENEKESVKTQQPTLMEKVPFAVRFGLVFLE
jgi:hypothetical protein